MNNLHHARIDSMRKKISLLLIEDNPDDVWLIREMLSYVSATSAVTPMFEIIDTDLLSAGLEHMRSGEINVVLLDFSLRDSRGEETFLKALEETPEVPIIVISDFDDESMAIQAVTDGAQDYLVKDQFDGVLLSRSIIYAIERRKAEVALIESERRLRSLREHTMEGIFRTTPEGQFLYANPAMARIFGFDNVEELAEANLNELYLCPDDREAICSRFSQNGCVEDLEVRMRRKDGTAIWIRENAVVNRDRNSGIVAYEGFISDITDRKRAEEENVRLVAAVEQSGESVLIIDTEGIIQYVNPAFEKIIGYSREETVGRNVKSLGTENQGNSFYCQVWDSMIQGEIWAGHLSSTKKDGSIYEADVAISPVRNELGRVVNYVVASRDITSEIALEAKLRQAQKMEAVGRLAGGLAHDFNNLLTVILANAELIRIQLDESSPAREMTDSIIEVAGKAAWLTRQLLAFSREQQLSLSNQNLNDIILDMNRMLPLLIGEDIELVTRLADDLGQVKVDPRQIEQVLMNLVVNAMDAMPNGGRIIVQTANVTFGEELKQSEVGLKPGSYVLLRIEDTGSGITPDLKERIFDPFFTTKEPGRGTGLGLSTVYGIVRQSEGAIMVDSECERGTAFNIYLPKS